MNNLIRFVAIFLAIFISCITMAQTPLTIRQVFDFNVGDEFHYSSSGSGNLGSETNGAHRLRVLDRVLSSGNDSLTYTIEKKAFVFYNYGYTITDTAFSSLVYSVTYTNLDSLIRFYNYPNSSSYLSYISLYNTYYPDSICLSRLNFSDSLLPWALQQTTHNAYQSSLFDGPSSCNGYRLSNKIDVFAEGLGNVDKISSYTIGNFSDYVSERLVYYKKGNVEVGTPYIVNVPVSYYLNEEYSFYPNPVNNTMYLACKTFNQDEKYIIVNQLGQELKYGTVKTSLTEIDLSDFPEGLYFIIISEKNKTLKFLKKQ